MKNTEKKKMFLQQEIKGLSNLEKVLLETADSVMDTRKKLEFGVQQIMFKVSLLWRKKIIGINTNTELNVLSN